MVETSIQPSIQTEVEKPGEFGFSLWQRQIDALLNEKLISLSGFTSDQLQNLRDATIGISTKAKRLGQVAALAGGITLLAACGGKAQRAEATAPPEVTISTPIPTEVSAGEPIPLATEASDNLPEQPPTNSQPPVLEPEPTATEAPEVLAKKPIHISGYISYSEDHVPLEEVKITLPEEVIPDKILALGFTLESEFPVVEISFPLSEWMGISDIDWLVTIDPDSENSQIDVMSEINKMSNMLQSKGITIDNPEVMTAANILSHKTDEGNWFIGIYLPNAHLQITDQHGTRLVNPAETLRHMGNAVYVKIFLQANTRIPNEPALRATGVQVSGPDGQLTVAEDFDIQPPTKINTVNVQSGSASVPASGTPVVSVATVTPATEVQPQVVTPQNNEDNTRVITVQSSLSTSGPENQPSDQPTEWTKEWQPNERVPMKQWWDEMVSKGYIQIDSLARQYGGEQLETLFSVINKADLVPNRQGYPEPNTTLIGNCEAELREVVNQGQGHITVSSEAFNQVPGGSNCEIIIFGQ